MENVIIGVQMFLALVFVVMKVAEVYVSFTASKKDDEQLAENKFYQTARGVYDFIKKEELAGRILGDNRITKALEFLESSLLKTGQGALTKELENKASEAFKAWHAEDKVNDSLANAVALEPGKKAEG